MKIKKEMIFQRNSYNFMFPGTLQKRFGHLNFKVISEEGMLIYRLLCFVRSF